MLDANPISTPMDPNDKINPNPDGNEDIRSNPYAKLLGELQFLNSQTSSNFLSDDCWHLLQVGQCSVLAILFLKTGVLPLTSAKCGKL